MEGKGKFGMILCFLAGVALILLPEQGGLPWVEAGCTDDPCGNPPCCNGDVNGDAAIDIADAISILSYLFGSGAEPVSIWCSRESCAPPGTGQTLCYDVEGNVVDCGNPDFLGQDGYYSAGSVEHRFVDNGDGTVIDNCTGLMWQKQSAPGEYTWQGALQFCNGLELAGHRDWRLPNVRELQSIVDYGRFAPAIDSVFIAFSSWYWSSTSGTVSPDHAWAVHFHSGVVDGPSDGKRYNCCVRAVRTPVQAKRP